MDAVDAGRFDIARVIQQTFAVLGRNIVTFSILGVVLAGIPTAIVAFLQFGMLKDVLHSARASGNAMSFAPGAFAAGGLGGLAALITTAILQGSLIYATVQDLSGTPASVGSSLAMGLRNFLSLIAVTLLLVLGVAGGMLLLIVPGVMLACAWCVAAPSLVADRTGIFGAFSRSAELTRGNRWQIFGLLVIVLVVEWVISLIFNLVTGVGAMGMSGGDPFAAIERTLSPIVLIFGVIRSTIGAVIGATATAVIYVELRRTQQGGADTAWLSDIFR